MHDFTVFLSLLPRPAAYLDPGTGSIITQVVIAGLLGFGVLLRAFWKKIFKKKNIPPQTTTSQTTITDDHKPNE